MPQTAPQEAIKPGFRTLYGVPEGQDARALAELARDLARERRVLTHIALDDSRLATLQDLLAFFAPDVEVIAFPAWDCLPYDRVSPHAEIVARRVGTLNKLIEWERDEKYLPRILLTTVNAACQRVMPKSALQATSFQGREGGTIDAGDFQTYLVRSGYMRTDTVREPGEFAVRGGIIDLFPAGQALPLRIDLFGDQVESIRTFDPASQRTEVRTGAFSLSPVSEFFLDPDSIERFRGRYREMFGAVREQDPLYEAVSEGRRHNGMDHWLPLFHEHMQTLFDYIPGAAVSLDASARQARAERMAQIADFYQARKTLEDASRQRKKKDGDVSLSGAVYHPLPSKLLYIEEQEWDALLKERDPIVLSPFGAPEAAVGAQDSGGRKGRDFGDVRAVPGADVMGALKAYIATIAAGRKVAVAAYSEGARERFRGMLEHAGMGPLQPCASYGDIRHLKDGEVGLCILTLESGFIAPDLAVMTEQDILGDRLARRAQRRKKAENFLTEVSSLSAGDLVVHIDHGVGRFEELVTLEAGGRLHDCLKIVYDSGDKLFVPVENIEVLSRFGADEGIVALDKLGGAGWQARKARVKKDLMRMADQLLKIAAARQLHRADILQIDKSTYDQFAARFPYQETDDQARAIEDVVSDLAQERPMDRLVCGDVGFGKTEVALRAAYVAAMQGSQVAVVVPTTLLARQHYRNFTQRFAGTGLRVDQLSRLVSAREAKKTRDGLADGSVNIVIGTHALFAKDIRFSHLGLLIVDEEQRFGVKQKERLKELKNNVHILTLTATPIPRTLQLSLTGVKDMSLITTPPVDRLAIRTFVLPFDPLVIREAILREHYRGGQTFYVCPRIKDLREVEDHLKELVPEVKLIAAHGQMSPADLEDRMSAFYDGQYDVLLATNIIESGLDIPSANTMVIHRADMFGLAQLYQMRGRIGRSKIRAYAYLTHDPTQMLTQQAQKRLEVIETLDTLGAGFQLASHDMDIRGAGNLLGEEQSGHIKEVGVELYQQMLEEAVAAARAGVDLGESGPADTWSPQINIGTSVLIPESYVSDLSVRMSLYRRLADLETGEDIEGFAAEMIDRFGPLPAEARNLLDIVAIKQLCRKAGIDRIEAGPKGAVIGFYKDSPPNLPALMEWIASYRGAIKMRPADQKLVLVRSWDSAGERVKGVHSLLRELAPPSAGA